MSPSIEPRELLELSAATPQSGLSRNILKQDSRQKLGQCDMLILLDNSKRPKFSEQIFTWPIIIIVLVKLGKLATWNNQSVGLLLTCTLSEEVFVWNSFAIIGNCGAWMCLMICSVLNEKRNLIAKSELRVVFNFKRPGSASRAELFSCLLSQSPSEVWESLWLFLLIFQMEFIFQK